MSLFHSFYNFQFMVSVKVKNVRYGIFSVKMKILKGHIHSQILEIGSTLNFNRFEIVFMLYSTAKN